MTSPWFMSKQVVKNQVMKNPSGSQPAPKAGSKRWLLQVLPIAVSIFMVAALLTYHLRLHEDSGPDASGLVQGLVVAIYDFFGFAPAVVLALLAMAWSSIAFFAGKLERKAAIVARVLTFVVCLAILGNLGGEGRGTLGVFLAEPLRSVYWLSMIVVTAATLVSAFLATDFFFYRYFEGGGFDVAEDAATSVPPRVISANARATSPAAGSASPAGGLSQPAAGLAQPAAGPRVTTLAAEPAPTDVFDDMVDTAARLGSPQTGERSETDALAPTQGLSEGVGEQEIDALESLSLAADDLPRPAGDLESSTSSTAVPEDRGLPIGRAERRRLRRREVQAEEPMALELEAQQQTPIEEASPVDDPAPMNGAASDDFAALDEGVVDTASLEGDSSNDDLGDLLDAAAVEARHGILEDHIASAVDEVVRDLHLAVEEGGGASALLGEEAEIARHADAEDAMAGSVEGEGNAPEESALAEPAALSSDLSEDEDVASYEQYTSAVDPQGLLADTDTDTEPEDDDFEHAAPVDVPVVGFEADAGDEPDGFHLPQDAVVPMALDGADEFADDTVEESTEELAEELAEEPGEESAEEAAEESIEARAEELDLAPVETSNEELAEFATVEIDRTEAAAEPETEPKSVSEAELESAVEAEVGAETELTDAEEDYLLPRPDPEAVAARQGQLFGAAGEDVDLLEEAVGLVLETRRANANFLRRRLRISTDEAKSVLQALAERGIIEYESGAVQGRVVSDEAR